MTKPVTKVDKELARRLLARRSLLYFVKQTYPNYQAGWVHDDICRRLERFSAQVRAKQSPRLMLLMPPRHGKSELASIRFPSWHLGHCPEHEIINVGYNMDLPTKFSRKVREVLRDSLYQSVFNDTHLDPDSQGAEAWLTTKGGGFTAAGVGGGITGKGAHILIVDDPIKNIEEADSILVRDALTGWYESTAYTRLAPGGGVLIIETWWNDDDLAGRLLAKMRANEDGMADQFEVIKYPALSEAFEYRDIETLAIERHDTALKKLPANLELLRAKDEALHLDRYPTEALKRIRANLAPRIWSALYQQNPVPDEGMYFRKEYFRVQRGSPALFKKNIYTAWDFAIGEKTQNDFTVGATLVQDDEDQLHVHNIHRMKGDSFAIVEAILDTAHRYMTHADECTYTLGFEDGQIFRAIEPMLKKRMGERKLYPSYEVLKPLTDKMARARSLQGRMQQQRVIFPEEAPWRAQAENELLRFPAGAHDDVVDALAWAANLCIGKASPRKEEPKPVKSWKDKLNGIGAGTESHMAA